jgi:hypothetical protein
MAIALATIDSVPALMADFKSKPPQCLHGFRAGNIPWQFHAGVRIGSAAK